MRVIITLRNVNQINEKTMDTSFDILTEQFRPMLLSYLTTLAGDLHVAEDLVQETFIVAHQSLHRFEKDGNFAAWIRGIARNKLSDHRRATTRQKLVVDSRVIDGVEDVYSLFDDPEPKPWPDRLSVMQKCISELHSGMLVVIDLIYRKHKSTKAVASKLDVTPAAIGQRLSRARKQIRDCMERRLEKGTP